MIPQVVEKDIIRSNNFKEKRMDIAEGARAIVFKALRKGLYSDPIKSLMREYLANAIDEHVKFKLEAPVEITFPTAFNSELRIRDYAKGLTEEQVFNFFGNYGASDKRESNELIGSFGFGCKSGWAYADSFTVISIRDGIKSTYNSFIDESDEGTVAKLTEEKSSEPSGLEIIVPVKRYDTGTFVSKGIELIKYFKTKPMMKGLSYTPTFDRVEASLSGDNWKYFGDSRNAIIICGQIGYPIDDIGRMGKLTEQEDSLLSSGLEIDMPIGSVEVTSSREDLMFSDITIQAIRKALLNIQTEIKGIAEERFKSAKTIIEAKTAFYSMFLKGGSYGSTLLDSIGSIKWNGIEIDNAKIELTSDHRLLQYTKRRRDTIVYTAFDKIQCSDDLNLYYDDTDRKPFMYRRRAKTLLDAGAGQVTVIQTDDPKALQTETGIDVTKLKKYSDVTPTVLNSVRGGNGVDITKRAKHQVNVFALDTEKLTKNYNKGANSDYWKVAKIVVDKQVYIPINRFVPQGKKITSMLALKHVLNQLALLGIPVTIPIYGVKPKQSTGNMIKFDDWLVEQVKAIPNIASEVSLIKDFNSGVYEFGIAAQFLPDNTIAKEYAELHAKSKLLTWGATGSKWSSNKSSDAKLQLAQMTGLVLQNELKLKKLETLFLETYPLMSAVRHNHSQYSNSVIQYLKLIGK